MTYYLKNFYIRREHISIDVSVDASSSSEAIALGLYDNVGSDCLGLYALKDNLYLYINGTSFQLSDELTVSCFPTDGKTKLKIFTKQINYEAVYHCDRLPASTPFYSEEEEDVDFGLWLCNVLNSDERKNQFLNAWNPK